MDIRMWGGEEYENQLTIFIVILCIAMYLTYNMLYVEVACSPLTQYGGIEHLLEG
jgi:hypothetical protein